MPAEVVKSAQAVVGGAGTGTGTGTETRKGGWRETVRRRGAFAGLAPQMAQTTVKVGLRFATYDAVAKAVGNAVVAGFVAGAVEAVVWIAPTERLKVLRIMRPEENSALLPSLRRLLTDEGVFGLWRGGLAVLARNTSVVGMRFAFYDRIVADLKRVDALPPQWIPFSAGLLAGGITTALSQPIDVLKSNANSLGPNQASKSYASILSDIWLARGWRGFTAGLGARMVKISAGQAIIFATFESVAPVLDRAMA